MSKSEVFLRAYLEAVYFTETGDSGQPSATAQLLPYFKAVAWGECRNFWSAYGRLIESVGGSPEQAGHDLWLTRNGHGVSFLDRPEVYGEELAQELTRACTALGGREAEFSCQCFDLSDILAMRRDELLDYLEAWGEGTHLASTGQLREAARHIFESVTA